ncbi:MAG: mechanosensitive ion channel family protein, partial [Halieaceae bacterium]
MNTLLQYFSDFEATEGVPAELLTLAMLLVLGAAAHVLLSFFVGRLHKLAEGSFMRWDDILMTALHTPLRMALWVFLLYLALDVYPATVSLKAMLLKAVDT